MEELFPNVTRVINRMRDMFKCTICSTLKDEDSIVFYFTCSHVYCVNCIEEDKLCVICTAAETGRTCGKQIRLKEDKRTLTVFRQILSFPRIFLNIVAADSKDIPAHRNQKTRTSRRQLKLDSEKNGLMQDAPENIEKSEEGTKNKKTVNGTKRNQIKKSDSKDMTACKDQKTRNPRKRLKLDSKEDGSVQDVPENNEKNEQKEKAKKMLNVTKRNHKGETPLHLACKKNNLSLMQELINAGANPNTQDNAGWTPLHDSIVFGRKEVIQFLLDNGARVNTPGHENMTPLHQSIIEGSKEVTQLLLKYGADKNARNIYGETPLDLIRKYDITHMEEILVNTPAKFRPQNKIKDPDIQNELTNIVLYGCGLNDSDAAIFESFVNQFNMNTVNNISPHHPPTHFIVSEDEEPKINWNVIAGVLLACQVVSSKWMKDSIDAGSIQPVEKYQLRTSFYMGFLKSRQNQINQLPGLFSGCHFYFGGNFEFYKTKNCSFLKMELKLLVEKNGGITLSRNPDPESLALEKTIPYHADTNSSLCKTSYYIIFSQNSWDPAPKYNMSHMKTLPVEWLLASIFRFQLIDPSVDQSYMEEI